MEDNLFWGVTGFTNVCVKYAIVSEVTYIHVYQFTYLQLNWFPCVRFASAIAAASRTSPVSLRSILINGSIPSERVNTSFSLAHLSDPKYKRCGMRYLQTHLPKLKEHTWKKQTNQYDFLYTQVGKLKLEGIDNSYWI